MSIEDRLRDAELLQQHDHYEGALLSTLVAVAALARRRYPNAGDREGFQKLLKTFHDWTIEVEFRGSPVDTDHLLYKWMRCQLVHEAALPPDLRIDHGFTVPDSLSVRAGGGSDRTVLLTPAWINFLIDQTRRRDSAESTNP